MTKKSPSKSIGGFSIIEFMVAFAILSGLVLVLLQIRSFTQQSTSRTQANSSINTYNAKLSGLLSESAQTLSFSMAAQENHVTVLGKNLFDINGDDKVGGDETVDATNKIHVRKYFENLGEGYPLGILRIQIPNPATGQTVTEILFKSGDVDPKSGIATNGNYCTTFPSVQCPFQPVIRVKPDCSETSALAGKCKKPTWKFNIDYLTDPVLASRMGLRGALSQAASSGASTDSTLLSYRQSVVYAGSESLRAAETPTTGQGGNNVDGGNSNNIGGAFNNSGGPPPSPSPSPSETTPPSVNGEGTIVPGPTPSPDPSPTPSVSPPPSLNAGSTTTAGTTTAGTTTTGSTSGCFVAGTLIETLSGPRPIESIQKGDWVWSRALDGTLEAAPVEAALQRTVNEVLDLHLSNGTRIRTTSEHPFWVEKQNDYLRAEQLLKGDALLGFHSAHASAIEVTEAHLNRQVSTRVFNLTVAGNHNYFAGGVLVHNKNKTYDCCNDTNLEFNGTQCCDIITGNCGTAPLSCTGCVFCVQGGSCACPGDAPGVKSGVNSSCPGDCKTCGCNCNGTTVCTPSSTTTGTTTGSSTTTGGTTTTGTSTTGGSSAGSGTTATTGTTTGSGNNSGGSNTAPGGTTTGSVSSGTATGSGGGPQISCLACSAVDTGLATSIGSCSGTGPIGAQTCTLTSECTSHCYCCNGAVTCVTQPTCCNCQANGTNPMDCQSFASPGCLGCKYTSTCGSGTTSGGTTTSSASGL